MANFSGLGSAALQGYMQSMDFVNAQRQAQQQQQMNQLNIQNQQTQMQTQQRQADILAQQFGLSPTDQQKQSQAQQQQQQQSSPQGQAQKMMQAGQSLMAVNPEMGSQLMQRGTDMQYKLTQNAREGQSMLESQQRTRGIAMKNDAELQHQAMSSFAPFADSSNTPDPEGYKAAAQDYLSKTGELPDWYTGDYYHDLPDMKNALQATSYQVDRHAAQGAKGMTSNQMRQGAESIQREADAKTKPIEAERRKVETLRALMQNGGMAAWPQVQAAWGNLLQESRSNAYMYHDSQKIGSVYDRTINNVSKWVQGQPSQDVIKSMASALDDLDNNVYRAQLNNIAGNARDTAKARGIDPKMVSLVDSAETRQGARLGGSGQPTLKDVSATMQQAKSQGLVYNNAEDAKSAFASGKLKRGDHFVLNGVLQQVN